MYKTSILQKYALKRFKKIHPRNTVADQGFDLMRGVTLSTGR